MVVLIYQPIGAIQILGKILSQRTDSATGSPRLAATIGIELPSLSEVDIK